MKVQQSEISLLTSHYKKHEVYERENLEMWNKDEDAPERFQQGDRLELTNDFKEMQKGSSLLVDEDDRLKISLSPKLMAIVRALEALTGKKINTSFMHEFEKSKSVDAMKTLRDGHETEVEQVGWGIDYSYERDEIHDEFLEFSAVGSLTTQDGKSIDFSLALSMQNHSEIHERISLKAGDALIDPLVINFGGDIVTLSNVKHNFDLDLDGVSDEFSFVGSGSGFLAFDKNTDGIINDGSELFGPSTANGFDELSVYDSDGNNWIDENDEVYKQLVIWTKDEYGNENLFSLKDKGIGALYLERVETPFELSADDGKIQGMMRESSIYIKENGSVGIFQEIDLVV